MDPQSLDRAIHQPTRLAIMTALLRNRSLSYTALRNGLDLTDGNVATHTRRLEEVGYVTANRVLAGTSFQVRYALTDEGRKAFRTYLSAMRGLLEEAEPSLPAAKEAIVAKAEDEDAADVL